MCQKKAVLDKKGVKFVQFTLDKDTFTIESAVLGGCEVLFQGGCSAAGGVLAPIICYIVESYAIYPRQFEANVQQGQKIYAVDKKNVKKTFNKPNL